MKLRYGRGRGAGSSKIRLKGVSDHLTDGHTVRYYMGETVSSGMNQRVLLESSNKRVRTNVVAFDGDLRRIPVEEPPPPTLRAPVVHYPTITI